MEVDANFAAAHASKEVSDSDSEVKILGEVGPAEQQQQRIEQVPSTLSETKRQLVLNPVYSSPSSSHQVSPSPEPEPSFIFHYSAAEYKVRPCLVLLMKVCDIHLKGVAFRASKEEYTAAKTTRLLEGATDFAFFTRTGLLWLIEDI